MLHLLSSLLSAAVPVKEPLKVLVLGAEGCGKSVLAEQAKFLSSRDGAAAFDRARAEWQRTSRRADGAGDGAATATSSCTRSSSVAGAFEEVCAAAIGRRLVRPTVGLNVTKVKLPAVPLPGPGPHPDQGMPLVCAADAALVAGRDVVLWDVGGRAELRGLWSSFMRECAAVVFLLDPDQDTAVPRALLHALLVHPDLLHAPFLVLANRRRGSAPVDIAALEAALGLCDVLAVAGCPVGAGEDDTAAAAIAGRRLRVGVVDVLHGTGVLEALCWLATVCPQGA